MEKMRTAEEMLAFIKEKDTGSGLGKGKCLEYLRLIEGDLRDDEYALAAFVATHTSRYLESEGDFVGAVTNQRIIMAKQDQEAVFKRIPLVEYKNMTVSWGKTFASMIIDTSKAQVFMENTVPRVAAIQKLFEEALGGLNGAGVDCELTRFLLPESTSKLRTATEMLDFCEKNITAAGMKRDKTLEYFSIIEGCLENEEYVVFAFMAKQHTLKEKDFAVAISNRRILLSRQEVMYGRILRYVTFDELEKISVLFGNDTARIKILSVKMEFDMEGAASAGRFVNEMFAQILAEPEIEEKIIEEVEEKKLDKGTGSMVQNNGDLGDVKMKTAEEMLQYCVTHGTIWEKKPQKRFADFQMAEDCLKNGEYAIMCFTGIYSETNFKGLDSTWYIGIKEKENSWLCVFTNKRIIMTQKRIPPVRLKSIPYECLYDVSVEVSAPCANVLISTVNDYLDIHMSEGQGHQVRILLNNVKKQIFESEVLKRKQLRSVWGYSMADEIRKFKELCDDGIITEEEFQKKKTELLDTSPTFAEKNDSNLDIDIGN